MYVIRVRKHSQKLLLLSHVRIPSRVGNPLFLLPEMHKRASKLTRDISLFSHLLFTLPSFMCNFVA